MACFLTIMQEPEMASTSMGLSGSGCLCRLKSEKSRGQRLASFERWKTRTKERQGVGTARRPPTCSSPFLCSRSPPAMPALGLACRALINSCTAFSAMRQSGLRNSTNWPFVSLSPMLQAAAKPRLVLLRMIFSRLFPANRWLTFSTLPSAEALSTRMTSMACCRQPSMQPGSKSPAL
ncbi:MAG: hypothetical protein BWY57_02038 [Betaproteobacteria bacterium ADurb.Bin341]|nr:MAG: hypothetical protein BWY57_02038 [Betaproteobacteria bacterium ADurb.Bin341]